MSYLEMSLFERTMQGLCSCSLILCWVLNKKKVCLTTIFSSFVYYIIIYEREYCFNFTADFAWKFWFCMIEQFSLILHAFACCSSTEVMLNVTLEEQWKLWLYFIGQSSGKSCWDRQMQRQWFIWWYTNHVSLGIQLCFADEGHHYGVTFSHQHKFNV